MLVKFLQDYRGKLTKETFFRAGETAEFTADVAERLIADGRALVDGDGIDQPLDPAELEPVELEPGETGTLVGHGEGEALPSITDPAEERQAPARRRK